MTLAEAEKAFGISIDALSRYVSLGFIMPSETNCGASEYRDEDFKRLGLVSVLPDAGFSTKEIIKQLDLTESTGTDEEQIRILRKHRRRLLDDIHVKQKALDYLDFIIWNKEGK